MECDRGHSRGIFRILRHGSGIELASGLCIGLLPSGLDFNASLPIAGRCGRRSPIALDVHISRLRSLIDISRSLPAEKRK